MFPKSNVLISPLAALFCVIVSSCVMVTSAVAQSLDTPITRLMPIDSPSANQSNRSGDVVRKPVPVQSFPSREPETGFGQVGFQSATGVSQSSQSQDANPVRHAVMMQQFEAPTLPGGTMTPGNTIGANNGGLSGGGMALPPNMTQAPPALPPSTSTPPTIVSPPATTVLPGFGAQPPATNSLPSSVPPVPNGVAPLPVNASGVPGSGDYAPMVPPQLGTGYATVNNCNCVTAPSGYVAASVNPGCAPVGYQGPAGYQGPVTYQPPPQAVAAVAPVATPPSGAGIPRGALISFGQPLNPVQVGQGIVGQPVAYVPGQKIRNCIRYFFP